MNLTYEQVCALLGAKDIEIYLRNLKIAELEAKIAELTTPAS